MKKSKKVIELIKQQGMVPLYYHDDREVCFEVAKALYQAGIRFLEFTNRGREALTNFKYLLKKRDEQMPDLLLAVGTIKNVSDAKTFIKTGADSVISPGIVPGIGEITHDAGLLWVPGCMTSTEIMLAENCDAGLVKLFPGHLLGPGFMSAIRELFPAMNFMPTGGVKAEPENLKAWFSAGVCAVGMGSKLISKEILAGRRYDELTRLSVEALGIINEVRTSIHKEKS